MSRLREEFNNEDFNNEENQKIQEEQNFQFQDFRLFPVRCFTCTSVLGNKQEIYEKLIAEGNTPGEALNKLNVKRICCRTNILNPPEIPLGLQLDPQAEDITRMYANFRINESKSGMISKETISKDVTLPVNQINVSLLNISGDERFNPKPLAPDEPRPKRIYELYRKDRKEKPEWFYEPPKRD